MEEKEIIEKAIKQAAASIWLDNLPLSKEYVENYKIKRIKNLNHNSHNLIIKRGGLKNGRRK